MSSSGWRTVSGNGNEAWESNLKQPTPFLGQGDEVKPNTQPTRDLRRHVGILLCWSVEISRKTSVTGCSCKHALRWCIPEESADSLLLRVKINVTCRVQSDDTGRKHLSRSDSSAYLCRFIIHVGLLIEIVSVHLLHYLLHEVGQVRLAAAGRCNSSSSSLLLCLRLHAACSDFTPRCLLSNCC